MPSIDRKQIKRMVVEAHDAPGAYIVIRLWNATGTPLYDTDPAEPLGGERNAPVIVTFPGMDIATAPSFAMINGTMRVSRGASAGPNVTAYTEIICTPAPDVPDHTVALVEFTISPVGLVDFMVQCGNATYVGQIQTGTRP